MGRNLGAEFAGIERIRSSNYKTRWPGRESRRGLIIALMESQHQVARLRAENAALQKKLAEPVSSGAESEPLTVRIVVPHPNDKHLVVNIVTEYEPPDTPDIKAELSSSFC